MSHQQASKPTDDDAARSAHPFAGSAALLFAAAIVLLAFINETAPLPFMPVSWHADRPIWYLLALASFAAGWFLLRSPARSAGGWSPASPPDVRFHRVVLYTREGCHLCDQAKDTLLVYRAYLPEVEEVDIDGDPELLERFSTCVPVVEIDGKVRFRGRVNEPLLRRLIEGARRPAGETSAPGRDDAL